MKKNSYINKSKFALPIVIAVSLLMASTVTLAEADKSALPLREKYSGYDGIDITGKYVDITNITYYFEVLDDYAAEGYVNASLPIDIPMDKLVTPQGKAVIENYEGRPSFLWTRDTGYIEYEVNVAESALYQIELDYYLFSDTSNSAQRTILIDGAYPFMEASDLVFYRYFKDRGEPVLNSLGDETRPSQIEIPGWRGILLTDSSSFTSEPLMFYLTEGNHTIRMEYTKQDMAVSGIRFISPVTIPMYSEVKQSNIQNGYTPAEETVQFLAQSTAIEKNSPTLRRESDGDPTVIPRSMTNRKLNVIGGYRWRMGNQSITWEFDVPADGLYKLGVKAKQSWNDGMPSYRQIAIDGKVPFKEFLEYRFPYNTNWDVHTLKGNDGSPYEIFLSKGTHTLTMTVKFGSLSSVIHSLKDDIDTLSDVLMQITLLAGSNPDPNYDYGFFEKMPGMKDNMQDLADGMQLKYEQAQALSEKNPAMASNFLTIKTQLEGMIQNPYSIARRFGDLTSAQESLSKWYLELQNQPLLIDYFYVSGVNEQWADENAGILERLQTTAANFFVSFTKDYDNVGSVLNSDVEIRNSIDVWIARGTEWAEVIKELADEDFTPKSGVAINVNVLPASQISAGNVNALMLSITSGRAPDVALGVDPTSPVEFAIRDAVYDLSKMPGFEEVSQRFVEATMTPYKYNGGVFAIPETMDFNVLFYRKDILSMLGIQIPNTREQLYEYVMPVLKQNGMEFYYERDFTQFLFQHGGDFYTDDMMRSALDTGEAYKAFSEYTELFTNYGIPQKANFYQRMRSGIMPIGVGNFALYMQLSVAAPELAGKWGIAPLPGVLREDGVVDRTAGAITGQGDVIMKQSESPEDSWEFLKWWSSADVQTRFASEVEALMGAEARWNTANKEAFLSLSWNLEDIEVLQEQWKWAQETPVVLGGYFTARHLTNAWTTVVVSGGETRDALEQAVKDINRELRMKQEEYGFTSQEVLNDE
jgi:ABC-type glycerol-3-phosphate transport system substrate-binding protein